MLHAIIPLVCAVTSQWDWGGQDTFNCKLPKQGRTRSSHFLISPSRDMASQRDCKDSSDCSPASSKPGSSGHQALLWAPFGLSNRQSCYISSWAWDLGQLSTVESVSTFSSRSMTNPDSAQGPHTGTWVSVSPDVSQPLMLNIIHIQQIPPPMAGKWPNLYTWGPPSRLFLTVTLNRALVVENPPLMWQENRGRTWQLQYQDEQVKEFRLQRNPGNPGGAFIPQ